MEIKDLTAILVVAMVGCILVAGFIPVVGESVSATTTFENEGYVYMTNDDSVPREYVYDGTKLTVNGKDLNYGTNNHTLIVTDDMLLMRESWNGITVFKANIGNAYWGVVTDSFDFTIYDGTVTGSLVSNGSQSGTLSVSYNEVWMAIPEKSDYILTNYNSSNYVLGNSPIYGFGITGIKNSANDTTSAKLIVKGNINDGFTAEIESRVSNVGTITLGDVTANYTVVNGVNGAYLLDSLTFVATYTEDENTYTTDVVYTSFIAPASVTAEKTIHADANTASIVSMIPFILIMGIVLMFVGVVLVRRYV